MARSERKAGPSPLQGIRPRDLHRGDECNASGEPTRAARAARVVVPVLAEVARRIPGPVLASVNGQAEPGETIAVYVRHRHPGRAIICGPNRAHQLPPREINGWRFYCAIRVLDEGAEALPLEVPC